MESKNNEVLKILAKVGAIFKDSHFVGTSGRHMSVYLNKDFLFPHAQEASKVGKLFAKKYATSKIDVVVGPALGGIILSQWTAYHLTKLTRKKVHGIYTEKTDDNQQIFKRGYDKFVTKKRVLVVEDLTTTGGSVKKVVKAVKNAGGKVVEVCVMVNRDKKLANSKTIGAKFSCLGFFPAKSYSESDCPLCKKKIPIDTRVGHGREYLKKHGNHESN
jgi:orotate phosphoribosyltransferase